MRGTMKFRNKKMHSIWSLRPNITQSYTLERKLSLWGSLLCATLKNYL